jgi:hypothetical protein
MSDENVLDRIEALVQEEHKLLGREEADATDGDALDDDRDRLKEVQVQLDRCWDLLRQRRARRRAGQDPDDAEVRSEQTVERYLQ